MSYSPGLNDVVAAETRLSSVDGEAGELVIAGLELTRFNGHVISCV